MSAVVAIFFLCGVAACGGGGSTPTTTTSYKGVYTDTTGTQSGSISATVTGTATKSSPFSFIRNAFAASTASGTLTIVGGGTVSLTGTLDGTTLTLSGDGYTFTGTTDSDGVSGTYTGSTGGFEGLDSTSDTVTVYCGTWNRPVDVAHDCNNERNGVWNIAVSSDGTLTGVENRDDGTHVNALSGTVSGNDVTISNDGEGGTGNGIISGTSVAGTFLNHKGCAGTWTGTAGCE